MGVLHGNYGQRVPHSKRLCLENILSMLVAILAHPEPARSQLKIILTVGGHGDVCAEVMMSLIRPSSR